MQNSQLPGYTDPAIKQFLLSNGTSGTIYALVFPENRAILEQVMDGGNRDDMVRQTLLEEFAKHKNPELAIEAVNACLKKARREYTDIFEAAWSNRQDSLHRHFFEAWKDWANPVVNFAPELWNFTYPTAGASEGLREAINQHCIRARVRNHDPVIHVFEGEYEGFKSYAEAACIKVIQHNRNHWRDALATVQTGEQFYISQPSAIDGNMWDEFDDFAGALHKASPETALMLDLTYVGSVAKDYKINATHPNIQAVFFSLSKPFGVYYHRIGGMLSRNEYPSLYGNVWFKLAQGLQYGTAMLKRSTPFDLPRKYRATQEQAIETVGKRLGIALKASDVLLFGTAQPTDPSDKIQNALLRGPEGGKFIRLCVTREMAMNIPGAVCTEIEDQPINPPSASKGPFVRDMLP